MWCSGHSLVFQRWVRSFTWSALWNPSGTSDKQAPAFHVWGNIICVEIIIQIWILFNWSKHLKGQVLFQPRSCLKLISNNMSKRARHLPGFYASLFNDVCDRGLGSKYRHVQESRVDRGFNELWRELPINAWHFMHRRHFQFRTKLQ